MNTINPPDINQSDAEIQSIGGESFKNTLAAHDRTLVRANATTLQVNVGFKCNQACSHCHLNAGPARTEMMSRQTMEQVIGFAQHDCFETIDITGGAPELHPEIQAFIQQLSTLKKKMVFRANLTALSADDSHLLDLLQAHGVTIVASFPSLNAVQAEALRGKGNFATSLQVLKQLNQRGYGQPNNSLELNLVVNPSGAFLPPSQNSIEKRFRRTLSEKWGIYFNHLYSFANVPLGRFRQWLKDSGNLENYTAKLTRAFNPCAVEGLMCRRLLSVAWDGYLYDCDFNLAVNLHMNNRKTHLAHLTAPPAPGAPIAVGDHCYTCTAGAGFT